jgi:putative two-component system hydrogenase maturation factor HypX/HoxX
MRILFLTSAHNSLSQRLLIELSERNHEISVCIAASGEAMIAAVAREAPDLILAPMLKIAIPEEVWSRHLCLIVHPGIRGDRGPSSLDWAIANHEKLWGVSILEAAEEFDAGAIWASHEFALPRSPAAKSSLYRHEVTEAAVRGVLEAVAKFESRQFQPKPLDYNQADVRGCLRPPMRQTDRAIDWDRDSTEAITRKIRSADSAPGVLDTVFGGSYFLYGAHEEDRLKGAPGQILAQRHGAICRGTIDGAVWITHLKARNEADLCDFASFPEPRGGCENCEADQCLAAGMKLPAAQALGAMARHIPNSSLSIEAPAGYRTFREITYVEEGGTGYIAFDFYNGAMNTEQCYRLRDAFLYARGRPTKVIALLGGRDFWSNGIHLNAIEAAADPALESWRNINAIDDLICEIIHTMSHLVLAGLRGNAGAGGAMLALAADYVYARPGVVLNPHYKSMGNLFGSEYWTYTLPRRVGLDQALELTDSCLPIGTRAAKRMGFLDDAFGESAAEFEAGLRDRARQLAEDAHFWQLLGEKNARRLAHERRKSLASYREEELAKMRVNFFGADPAYHQARQAFVFKEKVPSKEKPGASPVPEKGMAKPGSRPASRTGTIGLEIAAATVPTIPFAPAFIENLSHTR